MRLKRPWEFDGKDYSQESPWEYYADWQSWFINILDGKCGLAPDEMDELYNDLDPQLQTALFCLCCNLWDREFCEVKK